MPPHFIPAKSGVHRAACLALYRSLVRKSSQIPIDENQHYALRQVIRKVFRRNVKIHSPRQIVEALNLGYQSLKTFQYASSGSGEVVASLVERLHSIHLKPKGEHSNNSPEARPRAEAAKTPKANPTVPIVWPRPDTPSVLSRPFLSISGKRHIPKLVNTNGIPHLRFKKPQSPFLSRVIRDKIKQREKWFKQLQLLTGETSMAEAEDEWDSILRHYGGIEDDNSAPWIIAPVVALRQIKGKIQANHYKNTELARKMYNIVKLEKALAEEEQGCMEECNPLNVNGEKTLSTGNA